MTPRPFASLLTSAPPSSPYRPQAVADRDPDRASGELPSDPPPRYPYYLTDDGESVVPRLDWTDARQRNRAMDLMRRGEPVLLRRTGLTGSLTGRAADIKPGLLNWWGTDDFDKVLERHRATVDGGSAREMRCMTSVAGKHAFTPAIEQNNAFGSHYRVRKPETDVSSRDFQTFATCARNWTDLKMYLLDDVAVAVDRSTAGKPPTDVTPLKSFPNDPIGSDVVSGIDWEWLANVRRALKMGPVRGAVISAGTEGSLLPAHHLTSSLVSHGVASPKKVPTHVGKFEVNPLDLEGARAAEDAAKAMSNENHCESFQCQVIGRRRVLLISPDLSYKGLYPYPIAHPYDGYAMANLDDADYSRHPRLAEVRGAAAICEPGDVLFVPDSWWRHEQGLTQEHAAVEIRVGTGMRPRTAAAAVLHVGRLVEDRVTRAEGPRDARHWTKVIADAEEADWLDLGTVRGAHRIDMAQMVRDEIDLGLPTPRGAQPGAGRGRWQTFLRDLIDGRMEPTDWLNDNFVDPLFLSEAKAEMKRRAELIADGKVDPETTGTELALSSDELAKVAGAEDNFAVSLAGGGVLTKNAKRLPDDRSETQRSFPEFFVDSLNQKGWQDVRYTPMSILNPEHPNFVSKAAMERKQKDDEARKYGSAEGPPPPGTNRSKFRF